MKVLLVLTIVSIALPMTAQLATTGAAPGTTGANPGTAGVDPVTTGPGASTKGGVPATGAPAIPGPARPADARTGNGGSAGTTNAVENAFPSRNMAPALTPNLDSAVRSPISALALPQGITTISPLTTNTGITGFTSHSALRFPAKNTVGPVVAPPASFPSRPALSVSPPPDSWFPVGAVGTPKGFVSPALTPTTPMNTIGAPAGPEIGTLGPIGASGRASTAPLSPGIPSVVK
jgi:hypothetical protein